MALGAHFYSEGLHGFGLNSITRHETRASAHARIASSAPKFTYGKHKNSPLPLTGYQSLHSNAIDVDNDRNRLAASNAIKTATNQHSSDADDSPLSDAEPVAESHDTRPSSNRSRRASLPTIDKSKTQPHRLETGDVSNVCSSAGEEESASHSPTGIVNRSGRPTALSVQNKSKRKAVGVSRGRLPLNKLVLVPDLNPQECFGKLPKRDRRAQAKDPISSSAQYMLGLVGSNDSDATRAKRKANMPLSAIRKRLRTPTSRHKSLKALQRKYHASPITPKGCQLRRTVGDGFDSSELTPIPRSRYATKHTRKLHEPLLPDLQALTLVDGPLPNVVFASSSQLDLEGSPTCHHDYFAQDPAMGTAPSRGVDQLSSRRVEFRSDVDYDVSVQLASVSAPRRERSVSLECGSDDGDEGDDEEEEEEEEEAEPYVHDDEPVPEEASPALSRRGVMDSSTNTSPQRKDYARRNGSHLFRAPSASDRPIAGIHLAGSRHRCAPTRRLRLNELNEAIDDDYLFDDRLLDNRHEVDEDFVSGTFTGSVRIVEASHLDNRIHSEIEQVSSRPSTLLRTRSILKNSTPYVSSQSTRPESAAANTRRNSTIEVKQSRYFSAAKDQLDTTSLEAPVVTRRKSGSRFYASTEVSYSDDMVPETSPKNNYTDTTQLHMLKRTHEAVWTSSVVPVPETDLRSLTRSVSRNNGTLSQSEGRRSNMQFQDPVTGH